jgi:formylglycine-generating enzyme required for sulfatase activity
VVLKLYEDQPNSSIHGAAKWLLTRWQRRPTSEFDLARCLPLVDDRLLKRPRGERDEWRLNPVKLTLITIELPTPPRKVEIADTEISLKLFKEFCGEHKQNLEIGPDDESPVNNFMPADAFAFCEWLSDREQIPLHERCHAPQLKTKILETVPGWTRKKGYRLMTEQEFEVAARADTITSRYPGESRRFLDRYAQFARSDSPLVTVGVADLKPNGFGFFGLLGNAADLVLDETETQADLRIRLGGGSSHHSEPNIRVSCIRPGLGLSWLKQFVGFRVARTVWTGSQP